MTTETKQKAFSIERREEGVVLWFDLPESRVNLLRADVEDELHEALDEIESDLPDVVVIASPKDDFCVGADVEMIRGVDDASELSGISRIGQAVMDRLEAFPATTVAAIKGACLGGGLEIALACDHRIAANTSSTALGLPEVQLGLIPGAGGTVRLPQLVGIEDGLDLILTGKRMRHDRALRKGLVDEVVHPAILVEAAFARAAETRDEEALLDKARSFALTGNPLGRNIVFSKAREQVEKRTHGNFPAPLRAIEVVREGIEHGPDAGFKAEAEAFGELGTTPEARALIHIFRSRSRTIDPVAGTARPVSKVGVIGAGLMGAGIAAVTTANAGVPVRLRDIEWVALGSGIRSIREEVEGRRYLRDSEKKAILARVLPTTEATGFDEVDVVIEAVVERLEVKHQVLFDMESLIRPDALFATNTSSIPIAMIAEKAESPGRVLGMHYFSPVPQVPLLEVVEGPQTDANAVATAVELGHRQGKTVIVVGDGPGFYTSRILAPYIDEAARLAAEGVSIEVVDRLMTQTGFPVGPFRLMDEVGLDIGVEIAEILHDGLGERMEPNPLLEKLVLEGRIGKKTGLGFYRYEKEGDVWRRLDEVDESVYHLLGVHPADHLPAGARDRMLLRMVNEAVFTLQDGIIRTASDGDIGAVFGLGFPAHLGGPFHFIDRLGADRVLERLESLAAEHGPRFQPATLLVETARSGESFGSDEG